MFDSVVRQDGLPRSRFGIAFLCAVFAHVSVIAFAYWRTTHRMQADHEPVEVALVRQPAPPPPPPPPPAAHRKVTQRVKPHPRPIIQQQIIAPTQVTEAKPPDPGPDLPDEDEGEEGGVEGGVVGGVKGGVVGGVVGGTGNARLEFNDTMTPPVRTSGPDPVYTRQAEEHEVEGLMVVKCVVTVEGTVKECRVLRGLPFMDRAVVEALEKRRYRPALLLGKPVEVEYTFKLRLGLPR
jgi:periplasmic protein TonB